MTGNIIETVDNQGLNEKHKNRLPKTQLFLSKYFLKNVAIFMAALG